MHGLLPRGGPRLQCGPIIMRAHSCASKRVLKCGMIQLSCIASLYKRASDLGILTTRERRAWAISQFGLKKTTFGGLFRQIRTGIRNAGLIRSASCSIGLEGGGNETPTMHALKAARMRDHSTFSGDEGRNTFGVFPFTLRFRCSRP